MAALTDTPITGTHLSVSKYHNRPLTLYLSVKNSCDSSCCPSIKKNSIGKIFIGSLKNIGAVFSLLSNFYWNKTVCI